MRICIWNITYNHNMKKKIISYVTGYYENYNIALILFYNLIKTKWFISFLKHVFLDCLYMQKMMLLYLLPLTITNKVNNYNLSLKFRLRAFINTFLSHILSSTLFFIFYSFYYIYSFSFLIVFLFFSTTSPLIKVYSDLEW